MPNLLESTAPYAGLREAKRPKGAHIYCAFSIKNRLPMNFFYYSQLLAWANLEFDRKVLSFHAVNRWFDGETSSIFVAFYVRYLDVDHLVYIPKEGCDAAIKEVVGYAKSLNLVAVPISIPKDSKEEVEF